MNWTLTLSYIVTIAVTAIIPLTTIIAGPLSLLFVAIFRNSYIGGTIGYTIAWSLILLGWKSINDTTLPLLLSAIVIFILLFKLFKVESLDDNGRKMIRAEIIAIILVAISSSAIYGLNVV